MFGDGRYAGLLLLHQADAGARKLISGLEEVAAVGPQPGFVRGDQKGSGGSGEAGDVPAALEVVVDVFRTVEIGGRDQIRVDMAGCHKGAELCQLFTHGDLLDVNEIAVLVLSDR